MKLPPLRKSFHKKIFCAICQHQEVSFSQSFPDKLSLQMAVQELIFPEAA